MLTGCTVSVTHIMSSVSTPSEIGDSIAQIMYDYVISTAKNLYVFILFFTLLQTIYIYVINNMKLVPKL